MPKLWEETIEAHRQAVRETALDTASALVAEYGLRAVTMSEIAKRTGIGRATLYKYFPDVEAILAAWLSRQISRHFQRLAAVRDQARGGAERLEAVLKAFALIQRERSHHHSAAYDHDLAALLHRDDQVAHAQDQLHVMIRDLLREAVNDGTVRGDVSADELATYCLHALAAASSLPSEQAVNRLINVTMAGLRPPSRWV